MAGAGMAGAGSAGARMRADVRMRAGALSAATLAAGVAAAVLAVPAAAASSTVSGFVPGYARTGASVNIDGSGLAGTTGVLFHGSAAAVPPSQPPTDTTVTVTVPPDATTGPVTLTFQDSTTATSPGSFTVQLPTTASIHVSTGTVTYPGAVLVSATLTAPTGAVSGQSAILQRRLLGDTVWHWVGGTRVTNGAGHAYWWVRPFQHTDYRVLFATSPTHAGATTGSDRVHVRPHLVVWPATAEPILTTFRLVGEVRPVPVNQVRLERYLDGGWHLQSLATVASTAYFSFPVRLPAKGYYTYRVRYLGDTTHWSASTPTFRILGVNRTLRSGLSGPDVTALQRRLAALHYDVGAITGEFGYDTQHAVVAFEKVQGMDRDGVVGPSVWTRLARPLLPQLRHPYPGVSAIEVDLAHQVVYYAVNGEIARIIDASTGGGYYFYGSDGTLQQAITPTGHFSIQYKVDHWVTSQLGTLYRPAYFTDTGYALHGEGLVPSYPASHGCVRITVPAMDRLYDRLSPGMSIWIY